jgi:5-(carboxyamino)imidazole ribonucleotide synthase
VLVGVVGGGQLGRMLGLAGIPLGLGFRFLDPSPDASAGAVGELVVASYDDPDGLKALAADADVVTYEFENVPVGSARAVADVAPVLPPPGALEAAQDRLAEKRLFERAGVPVAAYAPVGSSEQARAALDEIGLPAVLKTRRLGYDGKGQAVLRSPDDVEGAWRAVGEAPSMLEAFVGFDRELSILAVRGRRDQTLFYPVVENHHRDGILRRCLAPAPGLTAELWETARASATAVLDALGYVGVLAIELFEAGGRLLANEMAPRVHNSGHWTIEGAQTSQFENHLRAICGLPLGSTEPLGHAGMVNLIGSVPDPGDVLGLPGVHLHLYGKEPRPGRKLGHVTVSAEQAAERDALVETIEGLVGA